MPRAEPVATGATGSRAISLDDLDDLLKAQRRIAALAVTLAGDEASDDPKSELAGLVADLADQSLAVLRGIQQA
jgi:hypothetical protein